MYICKTLRLMNYLVREGFDCVDIEEDRYKADYVVFKFVDSKELRRAVDKYYKLLYR